MTKLNYHLRHPLHPVMPVARTEITLNCGISIISAFVLVNKTVYAVNKYASTSPSHLFVCIY